LAWHIISLVTGTQEGKIVDSAFVITWKELLIAAIVVLGVYIAELLLLMHSSRGRGVRVWQRGAQARELHEIRKELAELKDRLAKLEAAELPAPAADTAVATPYSRAFTLAKQGLDVGQVASTCGISRAEAELIVAMQRGGES
jgi:hypothetical protein